MANSQVVVRSGGLGLPMVLFLIFLVLQLTGQVDWPWYAVAAPLLIGWGLVAIFMIFVLILAILAG